MLVGVGLLLMGWLAPQVWSFQGQLPITPQSLLVVLWPLLWGWRIGTASVVLYLLAGGAGLPVFADGAHGMAALHREHGRISLGLPHHCSDGRLACRRPVCHEICQGRLPLVAGSIDHRGAGFDVATRHDSCQGLLAGDHGPLVSCHFGKMCPWHAGRRVCGEAVDLAQDSCMMAYLGRSFDRHETSSTRGLRLRGFGHPRLR